jgi:hypothetical protein
MTTEELESLDGALKPLVVAAAPAQARDAVRALNVELERARAQVAAAREVHSRTGAIPVEVETQLRAYAVMYAQERERVVRHWGIARVA